jgi:branched-chain amino acid transport system substrate-binding protein
MMKSNKFSRRTFLKSAGAISAGAVLSGFPSIIRGTSNEILIGAVEPLTGLAAEAGQMAAWGFELAVEHVNKAGGVKSMGGAKLKLLVEDSESKNETGAIAAEKLIRKGIVCLSGALQGGVTMAVSKVADRYKMLFVIDIAVPDQITQQGFQYTFRIIPPMSDFIKTGIQGIMEITQKAGRPINTAVVIHIAEFTAKTSFDIFYPMSEKIGAPWKILKKITYPELTMSVASEVGEAKGLKPDALFINCRMRDAVMLVQEMYKQKFDVDGIFGVIAQGLGEPGYHKQGKLSDYTFNICPWHNEVKPFTLQVAKEYESRFKKPFNMNGSYAYDAILVIADALERAGSTDKDALRAALKATKFENKTSVGGPIQFDEKGDNIGTGTALVQIQEGKSKCVYPPESALVKAIYPVPKWDKRV